TFVIWGCINGLLISLETILNPLLRKLHKLLGPAANIVRRVSVYLLVTVSAIWFRATSVDDGWYITKSIFTLKPGGFYKGEPPSSFGYYLFALFFLIVVEHFMEYLPNFKIIHNNNIIVRYTGYVVLLTILLTVGVFNGGQF